jgi:hypothetical protein
MTRTIYRQARELVKNLCIVGKIKFAQRDKAASGQRLSAAERDGPDASAS